MKYHYNENKEYIGHAACGIEPAGSVGSTDEKPANETMLWDSENNAWVDELEA